jgi:Putative restriction endonuclease
MPIAQALPKESTGQPSSQPTGITVTWEPLPDNFKLEEKPVDNTGQPLIAAALRESLELAQFIQPQMLIAANFGLCATLNETLVIKAPDWVYVPSVLNPEPTKTRKSYTPTLEGDLPSLVIEFLSDENGEEYSVRRVPPVGRWFFYEQILKVPTYVIFEPEGGLLEVYRLNQGHYELEMPDVEGRHWIEDMGLFLGTWRGLKSDRDGYWLRWWDAQEQLLPWGTEKVEQAQQQAQQAQHQAEQERQRADRLAEYLRSQGINPDDLPN